jgi:hypothetical protein
MTTENAGASAIGEPKGPTRDFRTVDEIIWCRKKRPLKSTLPAKNHTASIPASAGRDNLILSLGGEPGREPDPQDQHPVPDDG